MQHSVPNPQAPRRRSVLTAAAWTVPTIAVAVAAPAAAASTQVPNAEADYFWDSESQGTWIRLDPAASNLRFNFSTQISFRSTADLPAPPPGVMVLTLTFSSPVVLESTFEMWTASPDTGSESQTFTFTSTGPLAWSHQLTANFTGTEPGPISVTASMETTSTATTSPPATDSATLVS